MGKKKFAYKTGFSSSGQLYVWSPLDNEYHKTNTTGNIKKYDEYCINSSTSEGKYVSSYSYENILDNNNNVIKIPYVDCGYVE